MNNNFIPIYQPDLTGNEGTYVDQCIRSTWISSKGEYINRFEKEFSSYLNIGYASSVSNGTVALHLALKTLGIGPGDEVIVPTLTYIASVNAIAFVGAKPVFVDSEPALWNIDPDKIASKITIRTKAILVVHLYGAPCEMKQIKQICADNNLFLVEDVAEAFGSKYCGQYAGSFGDISTFSFFGNKTITTGEGGMVTSNNKVLIDRATFLKSQAVSPTSEYWHDEIGFNYRMTNICAAIGVAQLERAEEILLKKRELANWYKEELKNTPLIFQFEGTNIVNSYWMVSVLAKDSIQRNRIRKKLQDNYVETRPLFYPVHTMPVFKTNELFPVSESLSSRGINLPSYPALSKDQVVYISSIIKEVF